MPTDLATLGIVEISRSLHTGDPRTAKRRCLAATVWFGHTVEMLRRMPSPTRQNLEHAALAFFEAMKEEIDQPRAFHPDNFSQEVALNLEASRHRIAEIDLQLISNEFDDAVVFRAANIIEGLGQPIDGLSSSHQRFAFQLAARAEREQLELLCHSLTAPIKPYIYADKLFACTAGTSSVSHAPLSPVAEEGTARLRPARRSPASFVSASR